ncbi:HNH endonuclease, partial [Poseidonibacter sp.]|uniref:HNH endonuclease n=1 Tax=Poseidonibacter sp. TaxID=2321188 RepID=UPI003C736A6E
YKIIANRKMQKFNNRTFESYYNSYIKNKLGDYSLWDVICGDFDKLVEIKGEIGTKYSNQTNIIKQFFNYDKKSKKVKVKTSSFQKDISKFIQEEIEVHTCYYCNIDFINTFKKGNETKNAYTLDHVLEKAIYPFLALSLHNLVPSCYSCNSKVKDSEIEFVNFSPTDKGFDFNERVKFKSFVSNKNLEIEKVDDFYIELIESYSNKYDKYIEALNLNNRYDYHKYKVIEMINKRREYPDSRVKELSILTERTEEEIKQDLFGIYLSEDLHKRPLSKLIKDISEELDLI